MSTATDLKLVLRMSGIGKAFSGVTVLRDVGLDLRAGEAHVLAGENGAGKSTLIKILAGVHTEYEGGIELEGRRVRWRSPHEAARAGISVIHQEMSLIPAMSVTDNIFLGRELGGAWPARRAQARRTRELLGQLGLEGLDLGRAVEEYPLSVRQMIEIAKALAFEARVIVMDEPTSALTEPEVERLYGVIADLKRRGCGIIYITHKMEEIYRVADRITVLRDGRFIATTAAAELPRGELVRQIVGRALSDQFPERNPLPVASCQLQEPRLRVEGLTVPDPQGTARPAVDGVGFELAAGEILGLAGLQGSGNSELLNGLFGTYGKLPRGRVELDGRPLSVRSPREAIRNGLALLTNDRKATGLVQGASVSDNLTLAALPRLSPGLWLRGGLERKSAERHREALRIRTASLGQEITTLSGGNQQKVLLARWLETRPKVLLLDDPTRGVDIGAKHEIYELMNRWTGEGMSILLVSSELPELLALSDRILVIHRGRATAELARGEATQEKILHAAMGD